MTTELQDGPDIGQVGLEYRPVSLLGVVGFVLGLFSILALVSPVGWIIPAAGAFVSIIAASRINANSERLAGRGIAIMGLCLSLWFGTWAPTKYFVDRYYLAAQAKAYTLEWLDAVLHGNLEKAHQGTLEFRFRQPHNTDLKEHYKTSEVDKADLQEYFTQGLIKDVVGRPPGTKIENIRVRTISREKRGYSVVLVFEIQQPHANPISMAVESRREEHNSNFYWRVSGAADSVALFGEEG